MEKEDVLDLKNQIDDAKSKNSELRGQLKQILQTLKKEHGCTSIEDAEEKLKTIEQSIAIQEKKIKRGVRELQEKYNNIMDEENEKE